MNSLKSCIIIIILGTLQVLYAQINYEPLESEIYNFLQRCSQKGLIEYSGYIKPVSRYLIAHKLKELTIIKENLTSLEKEELDLFLRKYWNEIDTTKFDKKGKLFLFQKDNQDIFRAINYRNNITYLNIDPIIGYENGTWVNTNYSNLKLGFSFHGDLGKTLGFNFKIIHTRQNPGKVNDYHFFSFNPNKGATVFLRNKERLEYYFINATIGTSWDWGNISIGKDNTTIGNEKSGNIILSNKTPAYPNIKLEMTPYSWLKFNYLLGWLNTNILDSNASYATWRIRGNENTSRNVYFQKYIALHSISFLPLAGLSITLGESIVLSKSIKTAYLIPLIPFNLLSSNNNQETFNSFYFISVNSKNHIKNTLMYANLLIDDLNVSNKFDLSFDKKKLAYSIGTSIVDLPFNNLELRLEYSKVLPGTYQHFDPLLTFSSSGFLDMYPYSLGHWAFDNFEQIYASLEYYLIRNLKLRLWNQTINKGTEATDTRGYILPEPNFLFADHADQRKKYFYLGIDIKYEIVNNLKVAFSYYNLSEKTKNIDGTFRSDKFNHLQYTISYGL